MIENTFLHLPGVGKMTERRLWKAGFRTWDDLWNVLHAGESVHGLFARSRQKELFSLSEGDPSDPRAVLWLDCLDQSRASLPAKNYRYFLELLRPSDHWRLLGTLLDEALYLDIETTGLSSELHYITVVGALYGGKFYQWTWPEPLDDLAALVHLAPLVVTFNGKRFDLPFLRAKAPVVPAPNAHIDLLYIARAAGFKGGQKLLEQELGLARDDDIRAIDGAEAVACWCSGLYGDRRSYSQLLRYNRADVEMMPVIAARLCEKLNRDDQGMPPGALSQPAQRSRRGRKPLPYASLQAAWMERRPGLHLLAPRLKARFGREPIVVGVDLRAKSHNPTGMAVCEGSKTETKVLYGDAEILEYTLAAKPDLVSIDAPLFLPRGRVSVSDDSPCRKKGGIVRDAERILWSRGIRVYPALIRQMQGLTQRGIELTRKLESRGIPVIESYPGAAQDILNIPRKRLDETLLDRGLRQFGYDFHGAKTHDELDAITSALVGQFYLADQYEGIGADDEGYMIIPRSAIAWPSGTPSVARRRRVVSLVGLPGAGKTTLSRALAQRLGWRRFVLGDALRLRARDDWRLGERLASGKLAPEGTVRELIVDATRAGSEPGLVIDGFPRHRGQIDLAQELLTEWSVILLDIPPATAADRIRHRVTCKECGWVASSQIAGDSPCPSCGKVEWVARLEDDQRLVVGRLDDFKGHVEGLVQNLRSTRIIRLDACQSTNELADLAVHGLLTTRLV